MRRHDRVEAACGTETAPGSVQRQNVRNPITRVLLGHRIVAIGENAFVQRLLEVNDPGTMKVVEDSGIHFCPVVHRHGV